ncbi:DUF3460 family protein [Duganella callida]|uniref:DUF3460 family protein n=1 Tax=Duganella callida TaxID=2561932 RepID=A0A4Y9SKP1_9BURK|nr:DUF3460 family protein [Duganella callida]TFW23618.1 DUF3460 family protein [Duganella callida]
MMKTKRYVSEFEQFMDGFLRQHPEVGRDQQLGWRIWWERPVSMRQVDSESAANSATRRSYYYD